MRCNMVFSVVFICLSFPAFLGCSGDMSPIKPTLHHYEEAAPSVLEPLPGFEGIIETGWSPLDGRLETVIYNEELPMAPDYLVWHWIEGGEVVYRVYIRDEALAVALTEPVIGEYPELQPGDTYGLDQDNYDVQNNLLTVLAETLYENEVGINYRREGYGMASIVVFGDGETSVAMSVKHMKLCWVDFPG